MMRAVLLVVAGALLVWGSDLVPETWQSGAHSPDRISAERSLDRAIADVEEAADRLDARMQSAVVSDDLSRGWEDLHGDALSIIREMAHRPGTDNAHDFFVRVETFWETYSENGGIGPTTEEWVQFTDAFGRLVTEGQTVSADGLEAAGDS